MKRHTTPDGAETDTGSPSRVRSLLEAQFLPAKRDEQQAAPPLPASTLLLVLLLPSGFLAVALAAFAIWDVSFYDINREPTATLDGPPLLGVQSNVGVLVMWAGGAISLFSYAVLQRMHGAKAAPSLLLWGGLITVLLAIDDMFLVHDGILPEFLGQSDRRTFLVYGLIVLAFLVRYRRAILSSSALLLGLALTLLAASLLVDQTSSMWGESPWRIFVEDGLKLVGISCWSAFFMRRSYYALSGAVIESRTGSYDPPS